MIFRYPEQRQLFDAAPVPLQVVYRELEGILMEYGIEPIVYRVIPGFTGIEAAALRRIEIMAGPYHFSDKMVDGAIKRLHHKYGLELIAVHRKPFGNVPERMILEIPHTWVEEPRVFLRKFGYIKGGNHV